MLLVGVAAGDQPADARWLAVKIAGMRIFEDAEGKMNLSVLDTGGSVLAVSQFTLMADTRKGRRPSFADAAQPEIAEQLYETFVDYLRGEGCSVSCGVFGAHMEVRLTNDGPVTVILDSAGRSGLK